LNLRTRNIVESGAMFFDLIGKLIYPRLPYWQRRRGAKILVGVAAAAIALAGSIVLVMWLINNRAYH
jgi:hypothetical protein